MGQNTNENTSWRELFRLYRDLVGPFQELERRASNKRTIEQGASEARGTIGYGYRRIIRKAFSHTIIWAIPFLIVFYVIVNVVHVNGEKLFYYYDLLITALSELIPVWEGMNNSALVGFILLVIAALFFFAAFPCLIFLFPPMIVGNVISRAHKISKAKKTLKDCERVLPQAEAAVQEAYKNIAPYIDKVPPNYRYSHALAFFSDSFFNFKVRNLQEAVNLYDQYLHQQRMEQGQREMAQAQKDAMDEIFRQLDHMEDLINSQEPVVNNYYY